MKTQEIGQSGMIASRVALGVMRASSRLYVFAVTETSLCRNHAYFLYDDLYSNKARGIP